MAGPLVEANEMTKLDKKGVTIVQSAVAMGWLPRWQNERKQVIELVPPPDVIGSPLNLPTTNLNHKRARSIFMQMCRRSGEERVRKVMEDTAVSRGVIAAGFDTAKVEAELESHRSDTPIPRPAPPLLVTVDKRDQVVDVKREPLPCSNCGTSYEDCNKSLFGTSHKACCEVCAQMVTHNQPFPDPALHRDEDGRTVVDSKPWRASAGANAGVYDSPGVIERRWSDGSVDYRCRLCPYTNERPRSVSSHYSRHVRSGEAAATFPRQDLVVDPTEMPERRAASPVRQDSSEEALVQQFREYLTAERQRAESQIRAEQQREIDDLRARLTETEVQRDEALAKANRLEADFAALRDLLGVRKDG